MPNPSSNSCANLELQTGCHPDPVIQSSQHGVTVRNIGTDRYDVRVEAWVLGVSIQQGASIAFCDNGQLLRLVAWTAGTFGPSMQAHWPKQVDRYASGTALAHSISTIAYFNSDAERDPLDTEPKSTYDHNCPCVIDVSVK
jgi:hypothetical protein